MSIQIPDCGVSSSLSNTLRAGFLQSCDLIRIGSRLPPVEWCFDITGQKEPFSAAFDSDVALQVKKVID